MAVAVMVIATAARAEAGSTRSAAYAHPVFEFLSHHSNACSLTPRDVPQLFKDWSSDWAARKTGAATHSRNAGVWQAMLPVLFIGLVAPLSLVAYKSTTSTFQIPASPALPSAFQRPPPAHLA